MKKIFLLLAAVLACAGINAQTNLASGKTATASTGNAALAVDGNTGTRWESTQNDTEWWSVDLGSKQKFDKIEILWEGAYGKSFDIIAGDQADFSDAVTIAAVRDQVLDGFPYLQEINLATRANARYVKFVGIARGTGYGYSFWEFRIFKTGDPELSIINLTSDADYCKVGGNINFSVTATDQYGNPFANDGITYTVSPADMGTMAGNVFTAAKTGQATITATKDGLWSNGIQLAVYDGHNVASADKVTEANAEAAANSAVAFDGNTTEGLWVIYPGNTAETDAGRTYTSYFILDLGKEYDLNMASAYFEGASSQEYTIQTSTNGTTWQVAASVAHPAGINAWKDHIALTQNNTGVRYVKFESTKAATQYGVKLFEFEVYGLAVGGELVKGALNATTGAYALSGQLTAHTSTFFGSDNEKAYDLTGVEIPAAITVTAQNPNALFIVTEAQESLLAGTKNLVVAKNGGYSAKNIDFIDGNDVNDKLTIAAENVSYTRPATYNGYQTVVIPFTTAIPSGVKAYTFNDKANDGVLFQEAASLIGGTPYLLIGASGLQLNATNATVSFTRKAETGTGTVFQGNYQTTTAGAIGGNVYILDDQNNFRKAAATATIPAFRAYITAEQALSKFAIMLDEATDINTLTATNGKDNAAWYDLQGRKVNGNVLNKGIYIHQGRKVVVR